MNKTLLHSCYSERRVSRTNSEGFAFMNRRICLGFKGWFYESLMLCVYSHCYCFHAQIIPVLAAKLPSLFSVLGFFSVVMSQLFQF